MGFVNIDESDIQLVLAGQNVGYVESYEVSYGIFTQPGTFTATFGWSQSAGDLIKNIKPYMPFKLLVGGKPAFSGRLDGILVREGSGTQVVLSGRDNIADLFRYKVDSDLHFTKHSYRDLLDEVLKRIGINPIVITGDATQIANKRVGTPVRRYSAVLNPVTDEFEIKESVSSINSSVTAKLGDTFFSFLKSYFDRANIFLWSGTDNEFILSRPNVKQDPVYTLIRNRDQNSTANRVNTKLIEFKNDITDRHAEIRVNGRSGTTKAGRPSFIGSVIDPELIAMGLKNYRAVRDKKTNMPQQATDFAKRILAEERRKGFSLKYVVAGHRVKSIQGKEVVYAPDTIIRVKDEELNIDKNFYIEDVKYKRDIGSGTTTQLTLVNPDHLVY